MDAAKKFYPYIPVKFLLKDKYENKDLYTATLIPEYGSWIRFGFLRDKKIDVYKYPITNRFEDDIVIQVDKITKKPVIHLLREMGLKDLEISKNLEHSDFFFFDSPFLLLSQKLPVVRQYLHTVFLIASAILPG